MRYLFLLLSISTVSQLIGQITQVPQCYYNNQGAGNLNIRNSQNFLSSTNIITTIKGNGSLVATDINVFNNGSSVNENANCLTVSIPGTTNTANFGYMLIGAYYMRMNTSNYYAKVTNNNGARIFRTSTSTSTYFIGSNTAKYGMDAYVSIKNNTGLSNGRYEVYITNACVTTSNGTTISSTGTGWVNASDLGIVVNTSNYKILSGTVNLSSNQSSVWGATITWNNLSRYSTEGFYEFKDALSATGTLVCTKSTYTSNPLNYNYTSNSSNSVLNFLLSPCTITTPTTAAATNTSTTSFNSNWNAVPGATTYILDVSTNINFTTFVIGYNGLDVGNITSYSVTGLACNTIYYYRVRASNRCGTGTNSTSRTATTSACCNSPSISSQPSDASTCPNTSVTFSVNASGTGLSYQWQWRSSSSSTTWNNLGTSSSVQVTPSSTSWNGRQYRCVVSTSCGATATTSGNANLSVLNPPTASISSTNSRLGSPVTLYSNASNANSYQWSVRFNSTQVASGNSQNLTFTPNARGVYTIHLSVGNNGCNLNVASTTTEITPNYSRQQPVEVSRQTVSAGDPVNTASGKPEYAHDIMSVKCKSGILDFRIFYMGQNLTNSGVMGYWRHNWDLRFQKTYSGTNGDITLMYPNGKVDMFTQYDGNNPRCLKVHITTVDSLIYSGIVNGEHKYTLLTPTGIKYNFSVPNGSLSGKLESIVDLNNNAYTLTYSNGILTRVTGPGGRYILIGYTSGMLTSVSNQEGHRAEFRYNSSLDLDRITNVRGGHFLFSYINHLMTDIYDPRNIHFLHNDFDTQGRVIRQTLADGGTYIFQYDTPVVGATTVLNPMGNSNVYYYNSDFQLIQQADGLLKNQFWLYDTNKKPMGAINQMGDTTLFNLDQQWNVTHIRTPMNRHHSITYGTNSRPTQILNALGIPVDILYDANGNPTKITLPNTGEINISYNPDGTPDRVTNPMGIPYSFTYNQWGDIATIVTPTGNIAFAYDRIGRVVSITDQLNKSTYFDYDQWGNIIKVTFPIGATNFIELRYDGNGNLVYYRDRNGNETTLIYDNKDRVWKIIDPMQRTTEFIYDLSDRLIQVIYPNGARVYYTYNSRNELINYSNDLGTTAFAYNDNGDLNQVVLPNGYVVNITLNKEGETTTESDGNTTTTIARDGMGRGISFSTQSGNVLRSTQIAFDSMSNITGVTEGGIANANYTLNLSGQLVKMGDPNGHETTFGYDMAGRLDSIIDPSGKINTIFYDDANNVSGGIDPNGMGLRITRDDNYNAIALDWDDGYSETFTRDGEGQINNMTNPEGTIAITRNPADEVTDIDGVHPNDEVAYTRNNMGQASEIVYEPNKVVNQSFHNLGMTTSVQAWAGVNVNYQFNSMGNPTIGNISGVIEERLNYNQKGEITDKRYVLLSTGAVLFSDSITRNGLGEPISNNPQPYTLPLYVNGTYTNTYQDNDVQTNSPYTSDENGNMLSFEDGLNGIANATYDAKNRIVKLGINGMRIVNAYDPMNFLVSQSIDGVITRYVWDYVDGLPRIIRQCDDRGVTIASYIWRDGILVARIDAQGNVLYYLHDAYGNVVALVNSRGVVTDRYGYGSHGECINHIGSTQQPFKWKGAFGILHQIGGLYYIRQRWYLALISNSRFLSQDPYPASMTATQSINRYVNSRNSSMTIMDVDGLRGQGISYHISKVFKWLFATPVEAPTLSPEQIKVLRYQGLNLKAVNEYNLVLFPDNSAYFTRYSQVDLGDGGEFGPGDHWLKPHVAEALYELSIDLKTNHNIMIAWGDMSSSNGKDPYTPGLDAKHHQGHGGVKGRSGLDIDFRYVNNSGHSFKSINAFKDPTFSQDLNQIVYDTAIQYGFSKNYQGLSGTINGVGKEDNHNDHGHLGYFKE